MKRTLPTDSAERKKYPLFRGCLRYFPAALAGVARVSEEGNRKHNPGEEMHHARGKSSDHGDCIMRHLHDADEIIAEYERHLAAGGIVDPAALMMEVDQLAWRALALSQELHEKYGNAPLAMGARLPEVGAKQQAANVTDRPHAVQGLAIGIYNPEVGIVAGIRGVTEVDADGGAVKCICDGFENKSLYYHHKDCPLR